MKTKIIIGILVGLVGFTILISGLFNKKQVEESDIPLTTQIEAQISNETTTTSTTTTKKAKTTKKVVKITKKKVVKKVSGFNIKASKSEMQSYAHKRVVQIWGEEHWNAFYQIVSHESGWNPNDINKKTGACGLFQFVPCSKGGSAYKTDYKVQIEKGIQYISYRYKTPNKAWAFWQKHHWY